MIVGVIASPGVTVVPGGGSWLFVLPAGIGMAPLPPTMRRGSRSSRLTRYFAGLGVCETVRWATLRQT
jgi:hypothetical protein